MKKFILFIILIDFYLIDYSQVINGTILDKDTRKPIDYALVYINGTYIGTNTDMNGTFKLEISKNLSMPITISALGYYSITTYDYNLDKPISIYLTTKVFKLKEVTIFSESDFRLRVTNMNIFRREFFGSTLNTVNCEITNEDDIYLIFNPDSETLKAFSLKPIVIKNKALGYKIFYYLDKFEYNRKSGFLILTGNYVFKEDSTSKTIQKLNFESKRRTAYLGSRMHFFRSLWNNSLDSNGFIIKDSSNVKLTYKDIVVDSENVSDSKHVKYLKYKENLFVYFYAKYSESCIILTKEYVYFDKRGFFDPFGIRWEGDLARQRIADLLPFEYQYNKNNR